MIVINLKTTAMHGEGRVELYLRFLPSPLDIQGQRVCGLLIVEEAMVPVTGATAIEAGEADIQAGFIILEICQTLGLIRRDEAYNGVETLGAVFSVYSLGWRGLFEVCKSR